jgi:hypothetical protein
VLLRTIGGLNSNCQKLFSDTFLFFFVINYQCLCWPHSLWPHSCFASILSNNILPPHLVFFMSKPGSALKPQPTKGQEVKCLTCNAVFVVTKPEHNYRVCDTCSILILNSQVTYFLSQCVRFVSHITNIYSVYNLPLTQNEDKKKEESSTDDSDSELEFDVAETPINKTLFLTVIIVFICFPLIYFIVLLS